MNERVDMEWRVWFVVCVCLYRTRVEFHCLGDEATVMESEDVVLACYCCYRFQLHSSQFNQGKATSGQHRTRKKANGQPGQSEEPIPPGHAHAETVEQTGTNGRW